MSTRPCIGLDFDGVLHSYEKGWQDGTIYGELDWRPLRLLLESDYAVAIITSRDPISVSMKVTEAGFVTRYDAYGNTTFWNGGDDGKVVLVTNKKLACLAYVDDRALLYRFGDSPAYLLQQISTLREQFRPKSSIPNSRRENRGRLVREAWISWARQQPPIIKPSWLLPWSELSDAEKEADRIIGDQLLEYVAANLRSLHEPCSMHADFSSPTCPRCVRSLCLLEITTKVAHEF